MATLDGTVTWNFPSAVVGTPPFVFGIHLHGTGDLTQDEVDGWASLAQDAWEDNLRSLCWSGTGVGLVVCQLTDNSDVIEGLATLTAGGSSSQTKAPGASLRCPVIASRPPKARANASYIPLPSGDVVNIEGGVASSAGDTVTDAGAGILTGELDLQAKWVARHQVGGPTATPVYRAAGGWKVATTASYLNRRYR